MGAIGVMGVKPEDVSKPEMSKPLGSICTISHIDKKKQNKQIGRILKSILTTNFDDQN